MCDSIKLVVRDMDWIVAVWCTKYFDYSVCRMDDQLPFWPIFIYDNELICYHGESFLETGKQLITRILYYLFVYILHLYICFTFYILNIFVAGSSEQVQKVARSLRTVQHWRLACVFPIQSPKMEIKTVVPLPVQPCLD